MPLDTGDNGLLAIDRFPINLRQIKHHEWAELCIGQLPCRAAERSYRAHSTGVVLLDVGAQGGITGVPP